MTLATSIGDLVARGNALMAAQEGAAAANAASRAAMEAAFIARANSLLVNFYVDQVAGNDANTGSFGSPFKSISRAVNATPFGGVCFVMLRGDYTFGDADGFVLNGVYLHVYSENQGAWSKISWSRSTVVEPGFGTVRKCATMTGMANAGACFENVELRLPDGAGFEAVPDLSWRSSLFVEWPARPCHCVVIYNCRIVVPAVPFGAVFAGETLRLIVAATTVLGAGNMAGRWWNGQRNPAGVETRNLPNIQSNLTVI